MSSGSDAIGPGKPADSRGDVTEPEMPRKRKGRGRSPILAAFLSFVFPGLGELYAGALLRAALFGIPTLIATIWLASRALGGLTRLAFEMFDPTTASILFAAIVVTGILRVASIIDAYLLVRPRARSGAAAPAVVAVLVVASIATHGVAGWYADSFLAAGGEIFVGPGTALGSPSPSGSPGSSASPDPSLDPFTGQLQTPAPGSDRINILLLGADSGLGYNHALTDSQILVSIDPAQKTVVMASIPRDLAQFPMYNGGTYQGKINSLMTTAAANPARYPDGGIGTLAREIGYLTGLDVNYYAFVNLQGFAKLINAVGGVDVVNPKDIADPGYEFPDGTRGFFLKAGPQHLNSRTGLAFVRTRMGVGDNDYTRARRQQLVLQAIRQKLLSPAMLPKIPDILGALAQTVKTNFPASQVSDMVALAQDIPDAAISKFVLGPPYATNPPLSQTGGVWLLRPNMQKIKAWSVKTFGPDSAYYVAPTGSPGASASPSG